MKSAFRTAIILFLLFSSLNLQSQKEGYNWCFGAAGLCFSTTPPTSFVAALGSYEISASISDSQGNLLFYTDGKSVATRMHAYMENGTGLQGGYNSYPVMILPRPGSANLYYILGVTANSSGSTSKFAFTYTEVDMSLAAGMGSVTAKEIKIYDQPIAKKLAAVKHANGIDYWVVIHELNSNNFRSYLVDASGISSAPVISPVGSVVTDIDGKMRISPSGKKLSICNMNLSLSKYSELFDFDTQTGAVSNGFLLANGHRYPKVCEFSPDGSKLYLANYYGRVSQTNMCAGSPTSIIASTFTVPDLYVNSMQLAPDGKIYTVYNNQITTIDNPDAQVADLKISKVFGVNGVQWGLPEMLSGLVKPAFAVEQDLGCPTVSEFYCSFGGHTFTGAMQFGGQSTHKSIVGFW
jgi:hypothetical protein